MPQAPGPSNSTPVRGGAADGGKAAALRAAVQSAMSQHLHDTAISLGSQLTQLPNASIKDFVMFSKCFLLTGEHRRCLATLEHRGLLAADNILQITRCLNIGGGNDRAGLGSMQDIKDILSAVQLAANCLHSLKEYQDCLTLLSPITSEVESLTKSDSKMQQFYHRAEAFGSNCETEINPISSIFTVAGRCMDMLENRPKAQLMLTVALRIDALCTEALAYLLQHGLVGQREKISLVEGAVASSVNRKLDWLETYYKGLLMQGGRVASANERKGQLNATTLAQQAEYMYSRCRPEEAYRLAREAYIIDPFDWNGGVLVYIVSMVELGLKTELFYLGHELAQSHPGQAVTWYCIGCYYWCCKKLAMAQAFLQKTTKLDKRFARGWVALGHVLVAAEESEHAISAYRTACRLLPGDHRAPTFMAKELIRTNNVTLAVHILQGALQLCPDDPITLNELGVAALSLSSPEEALHYFELAVRVVSQFEGNYKYIDSEEILCNYGTCLRRANRLQEALLIYQRCLAMNPRSTENHANVGFTLHLMRRFGEAIEYYHTVLGFEPAHAFCSEMLNNAIEDSLSLVGPRDTGPVNLVFGGEIESEHPGFSYSDMDGAEMELSPLVSKTALGHPLDQTFGVDAKSVRHSTNVDVSLLGDSVHAESHVRFQDESDHAMGTASGRNFRMMDSSLEPETPFSTSGSVCPFPGFGVPSTGATARVRPEATPASRLQQTTSPSDSDFPRNQLGSTFRSGGTGNADASAVEYSPYSYINALGGARRVSLNVNRMAGFSESGIQDDHGGAADMSTHSTSVASSAGHVRGTDLSGIYSEQTDESRNEFALCGDIGDSFQSSPSVMSFSRVTGNLSWSQDGDTTGNTPAGGHDR